MAKDTVPLDQGKLMDRLERLEKQIAKSGTRRGGGVGTALRAFTVGSLVGGGLALLYAPQKGEQIRQQLLQRGTELRDQATQVVGQAQQAAGQATDRVQQSVSQATDRVQATAVRPPTAANAGATPAAQAMAQQRQDVASGRENPA
jgi:gas vesicle protein